TARGFKLAPTMPVKTIDLCESTPRARWHDVCLKPFGCCAGCAFDSISAPLIPKKRKPVDPPASAFSVQTPSRDSLIHFTQAASGPNGNVPLERNIVLFETGIGRPLWRLWRRRAWAGSALRSRSAAVTAAANFAAGATQHLHVVGDDVGRVALDAVLAGVLVGADGTLDVHLTALAPVV